MQYHFDGGAHGRCRIVVRTSGKHGFAVPKIFQITCLDSASTAYTYRFVNNVVAGIAAGELTNATLCRLVIAQFLLSAVRDQAGAIHNLDTTIAPFDGPILNAKGVVLTVARLHSPRGAAHG
ncbi:MAG: hypothetical protein QFF03_11410 [Pseudomonadota bacterium]|nr:hypothetical protein [Pseudomonadota bacterium]